MFGNLPSNMVGVKMDFNVRCNAYSSTGASRVSALQRTESEELRSKNAVRDTSVSKLAAIQAAVQGTIADRSSKMLREEVLAKMKGTSQVFIRSWSDGLTRPSMEKFQCNLISLMNLLGCSCSHLVSNFTRSQTSAPTDDTGFLDIDKIIEHRPLLDKSAKRPGIPQGLLAYPVPYQC